MTPTPERIFVGWDSPALLLAVRVLADRFAADGVFALGGVTIAVPGARAGRRLKELLVEEAEHREVRLVPPRVTTVGHLPELLYAPDRPLSDGVLERRVWAAVLAGTPVAELAPVFPELPAPGDLPGWQVLARAIGGLHRQVGAAGLDFTDVAARCGAGLLFDDSGRWEALAGVQARFRDRLESLGFLDPESARMRALGGRALRLDGELWLVGVAELPEVARRFLYRSEAAVRAVIHAPPELAERFDRFGCVLPEEWAAVELELPGRILAVRDTPADQAREALAFLAGLDGRFAADQITVAVPDRELVPYLEQSLGGAGLPVRDAVGLPVERSAPFRLLEATAGYLEAGRYSALAALMRHPDFADWLDQRARKDERLRASGGPHPWIDRLDRFFNDRLPAALSLDGAPDPENRADPADPSSADGIRPLVRALGRHDLLGRFRGSKPLSAWMEPITELVVSVYDDARVRRHTPRGHTVLEFADQLRAAATGFRALPPALDTTCDAATAVRLLLDELAGKQIPPEGDDPSIELVGWLELHLDDAPAAVLTGFNEPFLPESVNAHPFLPDSLRSALGLEDNALRYARDAYRLAAIVHSTPDLRLIAGRRSATGDPLRPSRLMFAESGERLARRVMRFYGEERNEERRTRNDRTAVESARAAGEVHDTAPSDVPAEAGTQRRSPDFAPTEERLRNEERGTRNERTAAEVGFRSGDVPETPPPDVPAEAGTQRRLPDSAPVLDTGESPPASAATPRRASFVTPPEPIIRGDTVIDRLSVTAFRQLLQDPYLFALERIRRLESIDDAARELDPMEFGILAHDVLSRFAGSPEAAATDAAAVARRLEALLDEAVEARGVGAALPAVRLQVEQLRQRLRAFAPWQAHRSAEGWRIWGAECVPEEGAPFPVDGTAFTLTGRIDRIDHHPATGAWEILDYKTSEKGDDPERTHRRGRDGAKEWKDLQLPLYRHLAAVLPPRDGVAPPPATGPVRLGYVTLPADPRGVRALYAAWTPDELAQADEAARHVVRFLRDNQFVYQSALVGRYFDERLDALLGVGILTAPPATENGENGGNGEEEAA